MQLVSNIVSAALKPFISASRIYIAYSGGVDSHVLLHLCSQAPELRDKLCAVHIHHGIQQQADAWLTHCETTATELGVAMKSRFVDARPQPGHSPEETARNARYQAFAEILNAGEVVLSAQHRDDQMETLLLQLFRGAGLAGLAAMPRQTACGKGSLLRPLLDVPRTAIQAYAEEHRLHWIEDPSNAAHDYDRNYLRHAIVPLLKQRWPGVGKTVARAARHCANAQTLLEEIAETLLTQAFDGSDGTISIAALNRHDRYRQQLLLRQWFKALGQRMPPETVVERIIEEVAAAPCGHYHALPFRGGAVRRYRDKLYWLPADKRVNTAMHLDWPHAREILELPGNGCLQRILTAAPGIDPASWYGSHITICYRQGGECIRLPGRAGTRELKDLFQENGIPPWEREATPLVFAAQKLAAIADRWISADFYRESHDENVRLLWHRP